VIIIVNIYADCVIKLSSVTEVFMKTVNASLFMFVSRYTVKLKETVR